MARSVTMNAAHVAVGHAALSLRWSLLILLGCRHIFVEAGTDFYKILGITELAEPDEIKKAYRSQSLKYHPDRFRGDPQVAQDTMVKINQAFDCLKNPETRRMYEYYETDYADMAEYEKELKQKRRKDLYLYDSGVAILWSKNIDKKVNIGVTNGTIPRIWVVKLYTPNDADAVKQVSEFKRFGRLAQKSNDLSAGAVNCAFDGGLCQRFFQMMGHQQIPAYLILSDIQPDDQMATDFELFDEEKYGYPSAKELERRARKLASHEVISIDGPFLEQNITRNPLVKEQNATTTTIWLVWFYHSQRCSKTEACDKTVPGLRKLSVELKGVARIAAINCKDNKQFCRGHLDGASTIRCFVHRQNKHFVQSFLLDGGGGAGDHKDTVAVAGATSILKYVVQPGVELHFPDHPYRQKQDSTTAGAGTDSSETIDLSQVDINKLRVAQLKEILRSRGESCVGCADKSEFVKKVQELAGKPKEEL